VTFITIDGDDVGLKMRSYYLLNDSAGLVSFVEEINEATQRIRNFLQASGWVVLFSAADGVAARSSSAPDVRVQFEALKALAPKDLSFSAGFGDDLRQAYVALLAAKSSGKGRVCGYADLDAAQD
jgi:hypothetical protein